MTGIADIFAVLGVHVGALDPAVGKSGRGELALDNLVGIRHDGFGHGYRRAAQYARHALALAVLDAVARVDDQVAVVLALLEQGYGARLAAHVEYDVLGDFAAHKLLLGVYVDCAAALAQLVGGVVEYGGVVADMVGREIRRPHDAGYFDFCHRRLFEEICDADRPVAVAGREVVEQSGLEGICHTPGVGNCHLPVAPQLHTAAGREAEVAAGVLDGVALAVAHQDHEVGAAVDQRGDFLFQSAQAGVLEAQVERYLQVVQCETFVAIALRCPYFLLAQIDLGTEHVVDDAQVDAESDTREHQLALQTDSAAGYVLDTYQVLLEFERGVVGAGDDAVTELGRRAHGQRYEDNKSCDESFHTNDGLWPRIKPRRHKVTHFSQT